VSTLYEYYNTGDNDQELIYANNWSAQTFTPATAHKITSVKLKLYRYGSLGTVTVSIRATDGSGHPTGNDLCSGTTNGNTLPTGSPYEWREITLGAGYDLAASTKYAIVARAPSGNATNLLYWRLDYTTPTYSGGAYERSTDGGSSWTTSTAYDFMFDEWGEVAVTPKTSSDAGSGAEGTPLPSASLAGSETGSGIDAIIARLLASFDTGYGVEAGDVEVEGLFKNLFATELGLGRDALVVKREIFAGGEGTKFFGGGDKPPHRAS
jgi:hypothetical protein